MRKFESTEEITVPEKLIDQVIGQDKAVDIIKKAAVQKRNVLLIGPPGTGKSMLAQAMAELMPAEELEDVLIFPNPNNENQPIAKTVKTYPTYDYLKKNFDLTRLYNPQELQIIKKYSDQKQVYLLPQALKIGSGRRITNLRKGMEESPRGISPVFTLMLLGIVLLALIFFVDVPNDTKWLVIAALSIMSFLFIVSNATSGLSRRLMPMEQPYPKLVVDNTEKHTAPFIDATGARAGALLGDCKHDPLQSFFNTYIDLENNGQNEIILMEKTVDELLNKYDSLIERNEEGYEGLILPSNEKFYVTGYKNGKIQKVKLVCVNKRPYAGKLKILKFAGKSLSVTPEHKIYINKKYIEARELKGNEVIFSYNQTALNSKDTVISTKAQMIPLEEISEINFAGYVYNITTESGNLFANGILVSNSGGLGTPPHLRVECILPDTLVTLANGDVIKAKDLTKTGEIIKQDLMQNGKVIYVNGIKVLGLTGFQCTQAHLYRIIERNANETIYEIKTRFGEVLNVTGKHLIATMNNGKIEYITAEELKIKDAILKPRKLTVKSKDNIQLPIFERATAHNAAHLQIQKLSSDFCYWLGAMLSDGDFTTMQYLSINKNLCESVSDSFANATGFKSLTHSKNNKYFFVSFNRKEVYNFIKVIGLEDKKTETKYIPTILMNLPSEQSAALLAGLFDGDGSVTKDGELNYSSNSWKLVLQIRNLLLRFGIQTTFRKQHSERKNALYSIRSSDSEDILKFIENIPCSKQRLIKNALSLKAIKSKTMKRKAIPHLFELLDKIRKILYLTQDEVIQNRIFANYYHSDPSFKKIDFMLNIFKNRIKELQLIASISINADWQNLHLIAKKLHLSHRKVTTISDKDFRWNYHNKSISGLKYYRQFFSELCLNAIKNTLELIKNLEEIVNGDVSFDQIIRITKKHYDGIVYDLTTETGNFFANGILTHNCGAIHKANKGVLFIDEIASLKIHWQQELLTAMQEKKYAITGQSEMSSGALVKTEPVSCDFVLVAAGNLPDMQQIHPALRSRIRGAGYEVYVEDSMEDTEDNEFKLVQFIAQEVKKDGRIPHFSRNTVFKIIEEAKRMSPRRKRLTLNLRELGGLVRAAGDIAREKKAKYVEIEHLLLAKKIFTSIESQLGKKMIEHKKEYQTIVTTGFAAGRVNGLAVLGDSMSGLVLPIVAEVTPAASKAEGKLIATGKLGTIAKEAVENVSAIVKKHIGTDISQMDIHIQFIGTYEGVEGDSASISIAVGVISALAGISINQEVGMTGSLDIRGGVLPVGGVSAKIEAAIESGLKTVLIPKTNLDDVYLDEDRKKKIKIIPVANIVEVLQSALKDSEAKMKLLAKMKKQFK